MIVQLRDIVQGKDLCYEIVDEVNSKGKRGKLIPRPDIEASRDIPCCDGYSKDGYILVGPSPSQMCQHEQRLISAFQRAATKPLR